MSLCITGVASDGRTTIERTSDVAPVAAMPGSKNETRLYWRTSALGANPSDLANPFAGRGMVYPGPGETLFLHLTFPPRAASPMHKTPTNDYVTVICGELWLVMEDGQEQRLVSGDSVVQTGTLHAWQNRSDAACSIAVTMIGYAAQPA